MKSPISKGARNFFLIVNHKTSLHFYHHLLTVHRPKWYISGSAQTLRCVKSISWNRLLIINISITPCNSFTLFTVNSGRNRWFTSGWFHKLFDTPRILNFCLGSLWYTPFLWQWRTWCIICKTHVLNSRRPSEIAYAYKDKGVCVYVS